VTSARCSTCSRQTGLEVAFVLASGKMPRPGGVGCELAASSGRNARGKVAGMDVLDRITHDPAVMGGRPCIRGLRVTVGTIVGLLAAGETEAQILHAYPYLEPGDVQAALAYAAWRTQETELPLP